MRVVRSGRMWKLLGVAGVAGVAATGAIIARGQRQRAQVSADQVRARLRERLADADDGTSAAGRGPSPSG